MNIFFRRSFIEYKRQKDLKKAIARQTKRVKSILTKTNQTSGGESFDRDELHRRALLLLMPLVEVAWADGRVSRREMDAIVEAADAYTLVDGSAGYRELIERLLSRPAPSAVGRMWQDFHRFMENLPFYERQTVTFGLLAQAQFVAEQSSDSVIAFLRGERVNKNEQEALRIVAEQLAKAKQAAEEIDMQKAAAKSIEREKYFASAWDLSADGTNGCGEIQPLPISAAEDFDKLIPLVPLVKTAWAEGRVTRRERELIFEAARNMGIQPGSSSYRRLSEWLELHPTDEFYAESLRRLRGEIEKLPEEERTLRRLDVLSDCVNVAEASGGTRHFPAGGAKICPEEIAVVKHIASRLNGAAAV